LRLKNAFLLLTFLLATGQAEVVASFLLGYRGEPGVESKLLAALAVDVKPVSFLRTDAGLAFNLFENDGLGAAALGVAAELYQPLGLTLRLAAQHQQWNDWRAGENRALAAIEAGPWHGLEAGIGLVRRVPLFGDRYWSPFGWSGDAAEWNYLYRLRWKFIQQENWWLRTGFSSHDRFTARNPQQFPLVVDGAYRLKDDVELLARAGTAVVGFSGGLPAFHELELSVGLTYEF